MDSHYNGILVAQARRTPTREGRATRRRIASLCEGGPRTVAELARGLGRDDGGVREVLKAMVADGHLKPTTRRDARGSAWRLTPGGRRELLGPQPHAAPGVVTKEMRLVVIGERSTGLPLAALRTIAGLTGFAWGATLYGGARFIAAVESDADVERVRVAAAAEGRDTIVGLVSDLFDAVTLARLVEEVAGDSERALKPGD
jgi:DNA-binding MarR family transcriptional regulator